ncbi:MAG: DNA cytosine methyltransferase [Myroides odoratus]|jgi:DNA (cytosine-5)-methyltransferase 1|nr:DNA cytosine methyltransferase [Myroides odoratus]
MKGKYTVYSLFTGGGGFDIGFKEAGFEIIGASDIWEESMNTMKHNFPEIPFICKDVSLLTSEEILLSTKGKKPDVIIGGPPCQGFSVMGDKNSGDPRNKLFESYIRIVEDLQPKAFVFENVKGVKTMFQGRYLKMIANGFSELGYNIYLKVLNSKNYGVPQSRERVIIVGTKLNNEFVYPRENLKSIGQLKAYLNVGEAINDLVILDEKFPNHIALDHGEIVLERYKLIPEGGKLPPPEELPERIRRKNFGNTYVRLHREKIAPTMVPGNNAFPVHPVLDRSLTPREAARIQSFPDNIFFTGPRKEQCTLVGNAVPPLMAANIALSLEKHLNLEGDFIMNNETKDLFLIKNNKIEVKDIGNKNETLNFIDLFSGAGGIGIGFENAGLNHVFSADFDSAVARTFRHNNPTIPFIEGDLSSDEIYREIEEKFKEQRIDIIVGGPPCQGFSMFGKRRFVNTNDYDPHLDERNKLVFTYLKYVKLFNPKWFMIENVPGFLTLDNGFFIKNLLAEIKEMGYDNCEYKIINTADYGVPQKRKRFILIANNTGNIIPWPKPKYFEAPQDWEKKYRTVGEVLVGLERENSYGKFFNHEPMNHSSEVIERFSYIQEGKKIDTSILPENLKYSRTGKEIKSFSKVFFRLDRNEPSHTLVPGHSAFPIHPWLDRQLTVREAARIQTFPDTIEFLGNHGQQCKQVGNAFPPLAAEVFANAIWKTFVNNWTNEDTSSLAYYSLIDKV